MRFNDKKKIEVQKNQILTPSRPRNIFLRVRGCSLERSLHFNGVILKWCFPWFLVILTLFGWFEISTPKIDIFQPQNVLRGKNRKIAFYQPILGRFWHRWVQKLQEGFLISSMLQNVKNCFHEFFTAKKRLFHFFWYKTIDFQIDQMMSEYQKIVKI